MDNRGEKSDKRFFLHLGNGFLLRDIGENLHLPIPDEFKPLVKKIVQFNKQGNKFKKK